MLATNEAFFSSDASAQQKALEENDIDYLVVTKQAHPEYKDSNPNLKSVFVNSDVIIYQCNGR